ncbi:spermatogenesis-associated protein 24-like [Liolophura sinensis]|uniref:spermatogenesis-associated protein 24-like n=1 Tax=Liolophura sinensis TaxID=3198878 RepID=UPI0031585F0F
MDWESDDEQARPFDCEKYDTATSDSAGASTPTHVIVQRQLNDVILSQRAAVERIKNDTTICLKEKFIPRELYNETVRNFEAEKRDKFVSREDYKNIKRQLQEQQLDNAKTKAALQDVTEKLEFAQGKIEMLTKQIEREKAAYQKSFSLLKVKTIKESTKNVALETKCSEVEKKKKQQENILESKDKEIESLEKRLKAQDDIYKKQLGEMSVKLQQELYIAKTLDDKGSSRGGKSSKSVPSSKSRKL